MVDINGYEIKSAFSGGEPLKAIYSLGVKVWPTEPEPSTWGGLTFTALEESKIGIEHNGTNTTKTKPRFDYSKDGVNWTRWDYSDISLNSGDVIYFKGNNGSICKSFDNYSTLTLTGKIASSGNIMSLLYGDNYKGKLSLSGKVHCFYRLFYNCKSLTTAPELPATTLANNCYCEMFINCKSLTTAPELPATTLAPGCYLDMFRNCTSLTVSPELPATTLATTCYDSMFRNCTSLTVSPELPATTLADNCYGNMFRGCTSLTTAPELPATTLKLDCYWGMFRGCTSLTTAPELPATTLSDSCYYGMFEYCTSLTTSPELPATTLVASCYHYMFYGCTSLTTAPELPATTLVYNCYYGMFSGCTNLNYVKANFTTKPSDTYTFIWLSGVASTGTFVANTSASWTTSVSRNETTVPAGWTITK